MTRRKDTRIPDWMRGLVESLVQEVLERETDACLGARKHERMGERQGYRSGYYPRTLVTPLKVVWVTEETHTRGVDWLLAAGRRELSLVDCVSFVIMRELGLRTALAIDPHFTEQGFEVLPGAMPEQPASID